MCGISPAADISLKNASGEGYVYTHVVSLPYRVETSQAQGSGALQVYVG